MEHIMPPAMMERLILHQFASRKDDPKEWSKEHLTEALGVLRKFVSQEVENVKDFYNTIELHKRLLPVRTEQCVALSERLFKLVSSAKAEKVTARISDFRNNCYAHYWNYMRQEGENNKNDTNVTICFVALRFLLSDSVCHLSTVVNRLQQFCTAMSKSKNVNIMVEGWAKLALTLRDSFKKDFEERGRRFRKSQIESLEECVFQLIMTLGRHMANFQLDSRIDDICVSIVDGAEKYISTLKADLARTYVCKLKTGETLQVLAGILKKHPSIVLSTQSDMYDIFEYKSPWKSWSQQWVTMKKDNPELDMATVYDILKEISMNDEYKSFLCKALRCEINSYCSFKAVLGDALIAAGRSLETYGMDFIDIGLGTLAQGIGFWFGGSDYEDDAYELCHNSIRILNEGASISQGNPRSLVVACAAYSWAALSLLRRLQTRSGNELKGFRDEDMAAHPNRYVGMEEDGEYGGRTVGGISTVNLADEVEVGSLFKRSADIMFKLANAEDFKIWAQDCCPALLIITMRITGYWLSILGDSVSCVKAWHVVYKLTGHFRNRLTRLLSGAELIKQVPYLEAGLFAEIEEEFANAWKLNESIVRGVRPFLLRLELAKSALAFHTKNYQNGLNQLTPLLELRKEKDNYDISHHVLAETYYLLARYRALDVSLNLNFKNVPENLRNMTPVALAAKASKHLAGMTRPPCTRTSGWSDLLHNYSLLSSIMQMGPSATGIYMAGGKAREMRIFASDLIYLSQQLGLVTRSAQFILSLAEADMLGRLFDSCELKILALDKLLGVAVPAPNTQGGSFKRTDIVDSLKRIGVSFDYKVLINVPDNVFEVDSIHMPAHHYNKGERNDEKIELEELMGRPAVHKFRTPNYLFHSLKCSCYICLNPIIIPTTLQYLQVVASYAVSAKSKAHAGLIEVSTRHHLRGMFRIMHNFPVLLSEFSEAFKTKGARNALQAIYLPFFYETTAKSLLTQMELVSPDEIEFIIACQKLHHEACNVFNPKDIITKQRSFETLAAALYLYLFQSDYFEIRGSKLRDSLRATAMISSPVVDAHSPDTVPENGDKACPGPTKKGVRPKTSKGDSI